MNMAYNIVASVPGKVILEGVALDKEVFDKCLEIINEFAGLTEVAVATHTVTAEPTNDVKYIPFQDFRSSPDFENLELRALDVTDL